MQQCFSFAFAIARCEGTYTMYFFCFDLCHCYHVVIVLCFKVYTVSFWVYVRVCIKLVLMCVQMCI